MPAPEGFEAYPFGQDAPGVRWFSVTPSDTESLAALPRCLYVGGAGDLALVSTFDDEVVLKNVPAGTFLPFRADKVLATGTTATYIVAIY